MRRDADELDGFLDFLAAELSHPGLRATVAAVLDAETRKRRRAPRNTGRSPPLRGRAARAHGRRNHDLPRALPAPSAPARRPARRGGARARRRPHLELRPGPTFQPTAEGRLLGHVHLGLRLIEERRHRSRPRYARSYSTPSPRTTTPVPHEPPRPSASTTRTSSTPWRRRARSRREHRRRARSSARPRGQRVLGLRRLPRRRQEPNAPSARDHGRLAAGRARAPGM